MTALIALTQADAVLAQDPAGRTLIAASLAGTMPWTGRVWKIGRTARLR